MLTLEARKGQTSDPASALGVGWHPVAYYNATHRLRSLAARAARAGADPGGLFDD